VAKQRALGHYPFIAHSPLPTAYCPRVRMQSGCPVFHPWRIIWSLALDTVLCARDCFYFVFQPYSAARVLDIITRG